MKKKFINGLLMVALFVGFTSSMVSCKDYDDEKITNLEGKLADEVNALKAQLDAQKAALEKQIKDVEDLQKQCQQNCQTFQTYITNQLSLYVKQEDFIKTLKDSLGNYYTKKEVDGKITYVLQYTDTQVQNLRTEMLNELNNYVRGEALAQTIADLLNNGQNVLTGALDQYITNYNVEHGIVDKDMLQKEVIAINNSIDQVRSLAQSAKDLADKNAGRIDGLDALVDNLNTLVSNLDSKVLKIREDLDAVTTTANNAWAKAQANEDWLKQLDASYKTLDAKVDANYTELKGLIKDNTDKINALEETVKNYKEEADKIHKDINDRIDGVETDLSEFKVAVADLFVKVVDALNEINGLLGIISDYLDKQITSIEINGTYNPMYGELALPFNIRSNMLVVFRGQTSDRGLQFPSRAQYLAALPEQWNEGNFTDEDLNILGISSLNKVKGYVRMGENEEFVANQYVEDEETFVKEGNAGTIYLTVNPTTCDFSGTEFTLINSLNEKVPAQLSPLKKSDHKLTFGYTRADADDAEMEDGNGFYESTVTVNAEDAKKMALRFDLHDIKDVVSAFKSYQTGINLTTVMNGVYNSITDLLDASALKATWQVEGAPFSAVSQYAIGVAGVKPLSFSFAKDIVLDGVPGLNRVEDFISNTLDRVFAAFPDLSILERFDIESVELGELDGKDDQLIATIILHLGGGQMQGDGPRTATFSFPTFTVTGADGHVEVFDVLNPVVTVTINGEESTIEVTCDIHDFLNKTGIYCNNEPIENLRSQINSLLDDVTKFLSDIMSISYERIGDNIMNSLQKYIDEINGLFARFTQPGRFFKPAFVVVNADGMVHLSTWAKYPTKIAGNSLLVIPTNYNAEMLSPAFKKFVAVTDVRKDGKSAKNDDADCLNVLKAANQTLGFNEVIDGGFSPISFTGKSGYTYEFIYSAVDFSGKIVTRKFYMTVK